MSYPYRAVPHQIKGYHLLLKPQTFSRLNRGRLDHGLTDNLPPPPRIPSALWSALLPLFKGEFWPLTGRKVGPLLLLVLVEAAEEGHVATEGAKLGKRDRTVQRIDDAGIELAHHIEQARSRLIEIPSAHIPRIRKQLGLAGTASRSSER